MSRPTGLLVQDSRLAISMESLDKCIQSLDSAPGHRVEEGSIEVAFVDEAECSRLHKDFFDDPDPTDVMTFPGDPMDGHAGDIAICPAVAARAAGESGLPFSEELTLYLVHGWLHLSGLRDMDEDAQREMRRAEADLMAHLRTEGTLLSCTWRG